MFNKYFFLILSVLFFHATIAYAMRSFPTDLTPKHAYDLITNRLDELSGEQIADCLTALEALGWDSKLASAERKIDRNAEAKARYEAFEAEELPEMPYVSAENLPREFESGESNVCKKELEQRAVCKMQHQINSGFERVKRYLSYSQHELESIIFQESNCGKGLSCYALTLLLSLFKGKRLVKVIPILMYLRLYTPVAYSVIREVVLASRDFEDYRQPMQTIEEMSSEDLTNMMK